MKNHLKSKAWSEENLLALKICYDSRVPLKLMAQFFGKSENSISKMLTRSNIRPIGSQSRGKRPLALQSKYTTKEEVADLIKSTLNIPDISPENQSPIYYLLAGNSPSDTRIQPKRSRFPRLETWTSISHLIAEFQKQGKDIIPLEDPCLLRQGYDYLLNGAPMKSIDLLRIANTERVAQNLPRIFIEGITDNNDN